MSTNNMLDNLMKQVEKKQNDVAMEIFKAPYVTLGLLHKQMVLQYIKDSEAPEEWRPVFFKLNETNYEISNFAKIRNLKTGTNDLAQKTNRDGYKMVNLSIDGKLNTVTVHKLVADAFIDNPDKKPVVNHINGDKGFNWVGNLERATYAENTQHAIKMGLSGAVGESNSNNKFTEKQIHEVCKLLETMNPLAISKLPNVDVGVSVIESIKARKLWTHISKDYSIPMPVNKERPPEMKEKMMKAIKDGCTVDEILKAAGLENVSKEREYVGLTRRRFYKANPQYAPKKDSK